MPRPRRLKVAPSGPKRAKAATKSADPIDDHEGDHASVKDASADARRVKRKSDTIEDIIEPVAKRRSLSGMSNDREQVLEEVKRNRDAAMTRLEAEERSSELDSDIVLPSTELSSPAPEVGRRAREGSSHVMGFRRRVRQPSILGRGRAGRSSSVESNPAEGKAFTRRRDSSVVHVRRRARQPSILGRGASRVRSSSVESNLAEGTAITRGRDSSVLHVRRRARQPSILGRGASRVRSSSLGLDMDDGETAGRLSAYESEGGRAKQASILQSAKGRRQYDLEDEEDFDPEDASTPLNVSRSRVEAVQPSTSRRRRASPILVVSPKSPSRPVEDEASLSPSLPEPVRLLTPEPFSETMAPPRSSSRSSILPLISNIQTARPAVSPRRTRHQTQDDPPSSPPSLTHSPNFPTRPKRQVKPAPTPATFSTAQLQNFLPRRRQRPTRDVFDIESDGELDISGLASDEDELSHIVVPRRARRTPAPSSRAPTKPKPTKNVLKAKTPVVAKRTYGRRAISSDKENQGEAEPKEEEADPDDSLGPVADEDGPENSQELEARVGAELKMAKRKFEVVDKWELEYEEADSGSSPYL